MDEPMKKEKMLKVKSDDSRRHISKTAETYQKEML